jgi:WD40 repeat protein
MVFRKIFVKIGLIVVLFLLVSCAKQGDQFTPTLSTQSVSANSTTTNATFTARPSVTISSTMHAPMLNAVCSEEFPKETIHYPDLTGSIFFSLPIPETLLDRMDPAYGFISLREWLRFESEDEGGLIAGVAFASNSGRAVFVQLSDQLELIVADLFTCDAWRVWTDEDGWLWDGKLHSKWMHPIRWGPNDKFLIVSSYDQRPNYVIFDLEKEQAYLWQGECNLIMKSTQSSSLALGCEIAVGDTEERQIGMLEWDGSIWWSSEPIEENYEQVVDWAFSPDGDKVLLANEDLDVMIVDSQGIYLRIPVVFDPPIWSNGEFRRGLKWSPDGTMILVYGQASDDLCPDLVPEPDMNVERSCWLVFDSETGTNIWMAKENVALELESTWERLRFDFDADFSPDNKRLVMSLMDTPIRYFFVTEIRGETTIVLGNFAPPTVNWRE